MARMVLWRALRRTSRSEVETASCGQGIGSQRGRLKLAKVLTGSVSGSINNNMSYLRPQLLVGSNLNSWSSSSVDANAKSELHLVQRMV